MTRDLTEPIHSCTPSDRWALRVKEPMDRAIPEACNRGGTWELAWLASYSYSSTQQLEKCYNQLITQPNPLRDQTHPTSIRTPQDQQWGYGKKNQKNGRSMRTGNQGHQQKGHGSAPSSIQAWRASLAKSNPPETPTSRVQTKPKMVWPLQGTECDISCSIQTGPPHFMDNSSSLPCIPSYPICWNKCPWSKLLPAPTWSNQWWRTIWSGAD